MLLAGFSLFLAVLFTAPQIPAGMTGFHWNPVEWDQNPQESTGMGQESTGLQLEYTGMAVFLQEWDDLTG